jgi:drug/metabolite transporter (DMT)-like permease
LGIVQLRPAKIRREAYPTRLSRSFLAGIALLTAPLASGTSWPIGRWRHFVSLFGLAQLGLSTVIFLFAATAAKQWGLSPSLGKLVWTLALYSLGNLVMLRLIREFGMSISLSLSSVIQLVAVNVIALAFYGEKLNALQACGVVLAIVSVALITLGPTLQGR